MTGVQAYTQWHYQCDLPPEAHLLAGQLQDILTGGFVLQQGTCKDAVSGSMATTLPTRGRVTGGTVGAVTVGPPTRLPRSLPAMELASEGAGAESTLLPMPPPAAASADAMGSAAPIAPM